MTPAEEIRAAAAKLREAAAELLPVSTWWSTSPWASLMHPGIAEPLASWLESWDGIDLREDGPLPDDFAHALAVARAINGGS